MENNNPNNMSNEDLEKDMQQKNMENDLRGSQENVKKTTAAEGELITPEIDPHKSADLNNTSDIDDLVHQDGSAPDPESLSLEEEEGYDDPDKFSG
jgi:hypothetical protein